MEKKSGGFFHVFDWNRKSRKKLFSESPEHSKQVKKKDDHLPGTFLKLNEDEEIPRAPRGKGAFSCSSSVTDEECGSSRAPGVIARLMGLDSLPVSGISAPHSTQLFEDSWKCRENHLSGNIRESKSSNLFHNSVGNTSIEVRSQKVPSSPIEKFQSEPLPPRSAKSLQITCNRLLSPVKNPRFVFANNAAHVMEAAAKIIEPGLQSGIKSRPSSNLLKVSSNMKEREPSQRSVGSVADKSKRSRNFDYSDRAAGNCRTSTCNNRIQDNSNLNGEKVKGRSVSLAVQAKVNVQRREGLLLGTRDVSIHVEEDDNLTRSSHVNQKQKHQRKSSGSNSSTVLRQNNQKQNSSLGKDKSASKYEKSKSSKALNSKERHSTNTENLPQKKRLLKSDNHMMESESDSTLISKHNQCAQQKDPMEVSRWREHSKSNGLDIVSFTFATPMIKPDTGDIKKRFILDSRQNSPKEKNTKLHCHEPNMFSGDLLSHFLEQKLRELTSALDPSLASNSCLTNDYSKSNDDTFSENITGQKREYLYTRSDENVTHDSRNSTSEKTSELSRKLQKLDSVDPRCIGTSKEEDDQDLSPLSIFDATFSSKSCDTSESLGSSSGSKYGCSSVQAQAPLDNNQLDLLDSASSTCRGTVEDEHLLNEEHDLNYIREILLNTELKHGLGENMKPELFSMLEENGNIVKCEGNKENSRLRRRVLFDCIKELLIEKRRLYFESGYRAWVKGKAIVGNEAAEGLHKKIVAWECMADWTVDELVDEDMSSPLGRWIDFEVDKFDSGMEIEDDLVSSLIDEVVFDILVAG